MQWKIAAVLAATGVLSPAADTAAFAVVEKVAGAVGFYSADFNRLAGVKVGTHPHEIVFSPDRKLAYVSDNGILWMQYAGEGGNTISIIDLASMKKAGVIDLGQNRRPHGMDVDPRTGRMVCTTENPDGLLLIDTHARKVLRRYDVKGEDPHMVLLDAKAEWAYVSNSSSHTLAAVNLASGEVKLIPTDKRPQGAVLSRDGRTIYLTNSDGNSISIVDTARKERTGTIPVGKGPGRVVLSPDEKMLIYNLQPGEAVGFAGIASRKELGQVALGGKPLSLTISRDARFAYAGLQEQDQIAVVSVAERKIVRKIATPKGAGPDPVLPLR